AGASRDSPAALRADGGAFFPTRTGQRSLAPVALRKADGAFRGPRLARAVALDWLGAGVLRCRHLYPLRGGLDGRLRLPLAVRLAAGTLGGAVDLQPEACTLRWLE
ncbi:unnamed protein product, partial [Effrenium voratum]